MEFYKGIYQQLPKSLKIRFKKLLSDSKQLPQKLIDVVTDVLDSVEILGSKIDFNDKLINYSKPFEELVSEFFNKQQNVFLFIDELPYFINMHIMLLPQKNAKPLLK